MTVLKSSVNDAVSGDFRDRKTTVTPLKVTKEIHTDQDSEFYSPKSSSEDSEFYSPKSVVVKRWLAVALKEVYSVSRARVHDPVLRIRAEDRQIGEGIGEGLVSKLACFGNDRGEVMMFGRPTSPLGARQLILHLITGVRLQFVLDGEIGDRRYSELASRFIVFFHLREARRLCPILTSTNYSIWAVKLKAIFNVHGLWEVVEPAEGAAVDSDKNNAAIVYLFQALPEDLILQIAHLTSAKEVWNSVKTRYVGVERVKKARLQTLKTEYNSLRMRDSDSIDVYAAKLSSIASRSAELGETISDATLVKKLMESVPEDFVQIVASMEQFLDLETTVFQEAVGRLKAYEERIGRKKKIEGTKDDQVMLTYAEWQARSKENKGRNKWEKTGIKVDETNKNSRKGSSTNKKFKEAKGNSRPKKDKSQIKCFKCDNFGHYASECAKKKISDQEVNVMNDSDDDPALLMVWAEETKEQVLLHEARVVPSSFTDHSSKEEAEEVEWYLDNGASNHMTYNVSLFSSLNTNIVGKVKFGDGSSIEVKGKGSVVLRGKHVDQRTLTNVYYLPKLKSNIISLGQLAERGCEVRILDEYLWLYDRLGKLILKVRRAHNRLYKVTLSAGSEMCFQTRLEGETGRWQSRLGHANFHTLENVTHKDLVIGVPRLKYEAHICDICLAGKQVRDSFPKESLYGAKHPLELVSMDLCGPITPETKSGIRYFMLILDDYSRYMWVYFLRSKDDAFDTFKKFRSQVESQLDHKIKSLRSDRGGEFTSSKFKEYCELNGISRMLTTPYSPQQNGAVERRNRTVMNMTRCILKEMNMPHVYWAEGVRHFVYILNRLPTKPLKDTTHIALRGKKPDLQYLRIFGCVGHVKILGPEVRKLDMRSKPMLYLGVQEGTKGYRMLDVSKGKVVVSRDVKFDEARKWSWDKNSSKEVFREAIESSDSVVELADQIEENDYEAAVGESDSDSEEAADPTGCAYNDMPGLEEANEAATSRRSGRIRNIPAHLRDYVLDKRVGQVNQVQEVDDQVNLLLAQEEEPSSYLEASKSKVWIDAMKEELGAIERNGTWFLTNPPKKCRPIGLKWLFKVKRDAEGNIM
ncbi:hypothetical protein SSX86_025095 [Deinandra increscens subsp. villosa]|uniref:Polyprotein n=1 Tax=Deinandra increscens subsp. villosa TaxID=3103831 RepID=A0AAP0CBX9_9ASTR